MTKIGQLNTDKPIDSAIRDIREGLMRIDIEPIGINTAYDPKMNVAILTFKHEGKQYEFRSTTQRNCRLNMHGIARVIEFKVRAHLMDIEKFEKSMSPYLQIESGIDNNIALKSTDTNQSAYLKIGAAPLMSNEELKKIYMKLVKSFHPDMALSEEAKEEFRKRLAEFNKAIEAKVTAEQKALEEQNNLAVVEYQAQQTVRKARGESESIQIINEQLQKSPQYVEYMLIQKWDGVMPLALGSGSLLSISNIVREENNGE